MGGGQTASCMVKYDDDLSGKRHQHDKHAVDKTADC